MAEQTVDQQQEKAREKAEDDRYQRAEQQQAAYDDEYESRRETLSALALFQQDSVEQLAGGSRQNRRDYYQKLLSRLYIELRDLGASMLLDQLDAQLTQKHQGKCAMLVYSAVTQCYQMLVLDAPMADAANAVPDVFTAERADDVGAAGVLFGRPGTACARIVYNPRACAAVGQPPALSGAPGRAECRTGGRCASCAPAGVSADGEDAG